MLLANCSELLLMGAAVDIQAGAESKAAQGGNQGRVTVIWGAHATADPCQRLLCEPRLTSDCVVPLAGEGRNVCKTLHSAATLGPWLVSTPHPSCDVKWRRG